MSKRPLSSHGVSHSDLSNQAAKRQQTRDPRAAQLSDAEFTALKRLADNADDIIYSLQQLKQCRNSINERHGQDAALLAARQNFAGLSHSIAPALQLISQTQNPHLKAADISIPPPPHVKIPSMDCVTPWRSSEISQQLPPLPAVKDKALEKLAFTHPGFVPGSSPDKQYERLEWLGDAYLELIATALIDKTFLQLPSGRCSQIRERLVRNTTLAGYFREYGLESRARLPTDVLHQRKPGRGSSKDKDLLKTQSDMFEAYVAAVIISDPDHGIRTSIEWLKALWGRSVIEDVQRAEQGEAPATRTEITPRKKTPKEELSSKITVKGITIRYEKMESNKRDRHLGQELFTVAAYLDGWGETGKLLAVGSALSIREAGQKAAAEVLQNRKLLKVYEDKKKTFVEAKGGAVEHGPGQLQDVICANTLWE
ncbi:nucleolar RNAse III, putative [Cordyceps militaris CM01]|uniref:Nucleolar RNAse III, putative n=1 Tax=Cordyceps militaris (strain CM01) TaxID=983644 RepID=G3JFW5_CORMM|nr:nucleolar RNAse III, putative [Cordyceps militaris CM01]EGX93199.1 nucleolar RNAse III, putative [Cordyceps militaris CM01]